MKASFVLWLFLLAISTSAQNRTFRVPFRTARSLMLVSVFVNGESKTLVFDSGAERTIVNSKDGVERHVTFIVGAKALDRFPVIYANLSDLNIWKVGADGVLGQDVLRKFSSVQIDYHGGIVILEQ